MNDGNVTLVLQGIEQRVSAQTHLYRFDLALRPGAMTVLLGATGAGKTTMLRLMAGLDAPSHGTVWADGINVTGRPVRERDVAMVYQQFINYPSFTVAENIASPLRVQARSRRRGVIGAGMSDADIRARVREIATRLHIEPLLDRLPSALSGGQQQRVALARALAKHAPLTLLDEPLVNLDFKLREALRDELSALFAHGETTVVYATTDPTEALLLGGDTAVLEAGELLQHGPTAEVFRRPNSLRVARAFSDPPMNLLSAQATADGVVLANGDQWHVTSPRGMSGLDVCTVGIRAGALRLRARTGDVALPGVVALAEITGSETFVHVTTAVGALVAQLTGVHVLALGTRLTLFADPTQSYVFDAAGALRSAPELVGR